MLKTLAPIAALLALTAAAGAQTVTLAPTATEGYRLAYEKEHYYNPVPGHSRTEYYQNGQLVSSPRAVPQSALRTRDYSATGDIRQRVPKGGSSYYTVGTVTVVEKEWWWASFALPAPSANSVLQSATLTATVVGTGSQRIALDAYSTILPGAASLSLTTMVASALQAGKSSLSLVVSCASTPRGQVLSWSDPRLTLTFAPQAVPEPAAFLPLALGAAILLRRRRKA